jgi:hypothetical protein
MVGRAAFAIHGLRGALFFCLIGLGGCSDAGVEPGAQEAIGARLAPRPGVSPHGASLAFTSLEGPPDAVGARFLQHFKRAAEVRDIALAPADAAVYRLRGYLTAVAAQGATRLAYVWDLYDRQGRRVRRLTDEAGMQASSDPWAAVDDRSLGLFADRGAEDLAAFLTNTPEAIAAAGAQAGVSVGAAEQQPAAAAPPSGVAQRR